MNLLLRHSKRLAANRGFTVVELMVTVAIAAVLVSIAVPSMSNLLRAARLSSQTDLLVSTLSLARLEAVKRRTNFLVCGASNPSTATNCTGVVAADWSNGWVVFDGTNVTQRADGKTALTVTTAATSIIFNGTLGNSTAGGVTSFTLCVSGEKQQQVDVSISGHVSKRINSVTC